MSIGISGLTPLSNLIDIIYSISGRVILITGDAGYDYNKKNFKVRICRVSHRVTEFFLSRIFFYILTQIKIAWCIVKTYKNVDIFVFFIGGDTLVLPAITAWLFRKKVFLLIAGSEIKTLESKKDRFSLGLIVLQFITCLFAEKIILYSKILINNYRLKRWEKKIFIAHEHFVNTDSFSITTPLSQRPFCIGFIGRLNTEKGIVNFVQALPAIFQNRRDVSVIIVGDGQLRENIIALLKKENSESGVNLCGWINHDDLPVYLNKIRLLVIPSYTEGLPNVMLEAMACGTPVLATPVGAIPDIIENGKTGFLIEFNSPERIAADIIRAINSPDLGRIADNGRIFVQEHYTFEKTLGIWKLILE